MSGQVLSFQRLRFNHILNGRLTTLANIVVMLTGIIVGFGCFHSFRMPPGTPPCPSTAVLFASRSSDAIFEDVKQRLAQFPNCPLTIFQVRDGVVSLTGYTMNEEQCSAAKQVLGEIAGVSEVKDIGTTIPPTLRAALIILTPFQHATDNGRVELRLRSQKGCDEVYYEGENLVIDISTTKPLRYTYVDYYVADQKTVIHLLPNTLQQNNLLKQISSFKIGDPLGPTQWPVQEPFGLELLTVISSSTPLFPHKRIEPEISDAYIEELRQALRRNGQDAQISASHCFVTTSASRFEVKPEETLGSSGPVSSTLQPEQKDDVKQTLPSLAQTEQAVAPIGDPEVGFPSVAFLDLSSFDSKLSSTLKQNSQIVTISFPAAISINSVPPRLDKWFAAVEQNGGTVAVQEDASSQGPKGRFLTSIAITLAIQAYDLIKQKLLYSPAKAYNATVYYSKPEGTVTKVIFSRR